MTKRTALKRRDDGNMDVPGSEYAHYEKDTATVTSLCPLKWAIGNLPLLLPVRGTHCLPTWGSISRAPWLASSSLFGVFALVVWALVREAAKMIIRVMLVVAIGIAVALVAGWLDRSAAGAFLEQVGDWLMTGITGVVRFFARAWDKLQV